MIKTLFSISAFLIAFIGMTTAAQAASLCEQSVQRDWPSWIGQLDCMQQESAVPVHQAARLPRIPEFYQPLTYKKQIAVQPAAVQEERAGAQWWPDWIGRPSWY